VPGDELLNALMAEKESRKQVETNGGELFMSLLEEKEKRKQEKESQPFYAPLVEGAIDIGESIDSYTGAPVRSAIGEFQKGGGLEEAAKGYYRQFGEDPALAPTGKEIALKAGVPENISLSDISPQLLNIDDDVTRQLKEQGFKIKEQPLKLIEKGDPLDISPAGAAGLAVDMLADPLTLVTGGTVKAGGRALKSVSKAGGKVARAAKDMVKKTPVVLKASEAAERLKNADNLLTESGKALKTSVGNIFNPSRADDFKELKIIAEKHGIDPKSLPEAIEFGEDSFISRRGRNIAEGPLGEARLKKFNSAIDDISDASYNYVKKIGNGEPLDVFAAGDSIRDGFKAGIDDALNQVDITYKSLDSMLPGYVLNEKSLNKLSRNLTRLEKRASRNVVEGITKTSRSQAKEILQAIRSAKSGDGSLSTVLARMDEIKKVAYPKNKTAAELPSDLKALQKIYREMRGAIVESVKVDVDPAIAKQLVDNNKRLTDLFNQTSKVSDIIDKASDGKSIYTKLIKNGSPETIDVLASILPPEEFKKIKGAFLNDIIKLNASNDLMFGSTIKGLKAKLPLAKKILTPQEMKDFGEILHLGRRTGSKFLSSSGTGGSNLFSDIGKTLKSSVENEAILEAAKRKARAATMRTKFKASPKAGGEVQKLLSPAVKEKKRLGDFVGAASKGISRTARKAQAIKAVSPQNQEGNLGDKKDFRVRKRARR